MAEFPVNCPPGIAVVHIDKDTFKQIFRDHWETFKATYPTFDTPDYNIPVQRMLDCGDPEKMGFVQYRCLNCGETRRSPSPASRASAFPVRIPTPSNGPISLGGGFSPA